MEDANLQLNGIYEWESDKAMGLTYILQLIVTGITNGSIYILISLGIIIVYKCTQVINFSQGEFVVLGGFLFYTATSFGVPVPIAFVATVLFIGFVVGSAVGYFGLRPFIKRNIPPGTITLATLGLSMVIKMAMILIWGKLPVRVPAWSGEETIRFFGLSIQPQAVWVLAITVVAFILVLLFLEKTLLGKSFRACSENRFFARLLGIDDNKMLIVAMVISAMLGAIAGAAITPISYAVYDFGITYTINGFIAAVLGGLNNPKGALYGGLLIGLLSSLTAGLIGASFSDIVVVMALLAVLIIKPTGLVAGISGGRK